MPSLVAGLSRNEKVYRRGGVGLGGMLEGGGEGMTMGRLRKLQREGSKRQAEELTGEDGPADTAVGNLQAAYLLSVTEGGEEELEQTHDMRAEHLRSALDLARSAEDTRLVVVALHCLAELAHERGDLAEELRRLQELESVVCEKRELRGWFADCCRRMVSVYTRFAAQSRRQEASSAHAGPTPVAEGASNEEKGPPASEDATPSAQYDTKAAQMYLNRYRGLVTEVGWSLRSEAKSAAVGRYEARQPL
jgi:hypothetical protein